MRKRDQVKAGKIIGRSAQRNLNSSGKTNKGWNAGIMGAGAASAAYNIYKYMECECDE